MPKGKSKSSSQSTKAKSPTAACAIIPDFLYLGPVSAASNATYLSRNSISHVLSIGKSPTAPVEGITYQRLSLLDDEDADITPVVEKACEFIDGVKSKNGRVLVHCSAAISRSPTIVAAYLMRMSPGGIRLIVALEMLVEGRDSIAPNIGFLKQLSFIEKEVFGNTTIDFDGVEGKVRLKEILRKTQLEG